jgi:hypothetical protein
LVVANALRTRRGDRSTESDSAWTVHIADPRSVCHSRAMSKITTEIASDAVRKIEPELRELFTKVVEHDPYEAVKILEPYPDDNDVCGV